MFKSKFGQATIGVALAILIAGLVVGCGSGNTDGGKGNNDAGIGEQFVADGGAGATLRITAPQRIGVGERREFFVTAIDPSGAGLAYIRIFCETEHGIAIIEPSRGGVAFEHTNGAGIMSGVLGGVAPGSYTLECRGPQGFGLRDRAHLMIVGPGPDDFIGFPGAAGGNLGGGTLVEAPDADAEEAEEDDDE